MDKHAGKHIVHEKSMGIHMVHEDTLSTRGITQCKKKQRLNAKYIVNGKTHSNWETQYVETHMDKRMSLTEKKHGAHGTTYVGRRNNTGWIEQHSTRINTWKTI